MFNLWIDLETTGLDPTKHSIIEIAAIFTRTTDRKIEILNRLHHVVQPIRNEWNLDAVVMHQTSGLIKDLTNGFHLGSTANQLWAMVLNFPVNELILAGRSVHFDRGFLKEFIPEVENRLHHRHLDMSSVQMFLESAGMEIQRNESNHRALSDVEYSIKQYEEFLKLVGTLNGRSIII